MVLSRCINQHGCRHDKNGKLSLLATVHKDLIHSFETESMLVVKLTQTLKSALAGLLRLGLPPVGAQALCCSRLMRIEKVVRIGKYLLSIEGKTEDPPISVCVILVCLDVTQALRNDDEIYLMGAPQHLMKLSRLTISVYSKWYVKVQSEESS